jgi:hypothetical protein
VWFSILPLSGRGARFNPVVIYQAAVSLRNSVGERCGSVYRARQLSSGKVRSDEFLKRFVGRYEFTGDDEIEAFARQLA